MNPSSHPGLHVVGLWALIRSRDLSTESGRHFTLYSMLATALFSYHTVRIMRVQMVDDTIKVQHCIDLHCLKGYGPDGGDVRWLQVATIVGGERFR